MARVANPIRGMGVLAREWLWSNYVAADSSPNAAGPHPGSAVPSDSRSELRVDISGEQSDDLVVSALSAGMPVLTRGCRVGYRKDTEAVTQLRGWNPGSVLQRWHAIVWAPAGTATYTAPSTCVIPSSQTVLVVYGRVVGGSTSYCGTFYPYGGTEPSPVAITTDGGTNSIWAVCCLPGSERVLAMLNEQSGFGTGDLYYSDDVGATWAIWAKAPLDTSMSITTRYRARLLVAGEDLLYIIIGDQAGTTHLHQHVSNSLGSSFTEVDDWSSPGGTPDVVVLPSGKIGIVTISGGSLPQWRTVVSPYEPFSDATPANIDAAETVSEVAACVDQAGVVWVYARSSGAVFVWRSDDEGATWVKSSVGLLASGDPASYPINLAPVAAAGGVHIAHQWAANPGDEDLSIAVLSAGGWGNWTAGVYHSTATPIVDLDQERIGFGPTVVAGALTHTLLPFDLPEDQGWTKTGAGTVTLSAGAIFFDTVAAQALYTPPAGVAIGTSVRFVGLFDLNVAAGGSLTTSDVAIRLLLTDGATHHEVVVRFSTAGFRIRDQVAAAVLADAVVDMSTGWHQVKVCVSHANPAAFSLLEVMHRSPGSATWTLVYSGAMAGGGVVAAGVLEVGHLVATTSQSSWRIAAISHGWGSSTTPWDYSESSSSNYNSVAGRILTVRPFPLGDTATDGASFIAGTDGPARVGETHAIDVVYDYGPERLFFDVSPSADEPWRGKTSALERTFVVGPSGGSRVTSLGSRSLLFAVRKANVRTIVLEGDAGAGYVALGTMDLATGFTGLTATCTGDLVEPTVPGTAAASRYLQRGELVSGTCIVNGTFAKILHQEEGRWTATTTRRPRIVVDRAVTSGACVLVHHSGVLVIHNVSTAYQKFRIRIPAQLTRDGYPEIGNAGVFAYAPVGAQWSNGWGYEERPNTSFRRNKRGTERGVEDGPVQRVYSGSWPDGVRLAHLRQDAAPDYLSADAAHEPLAALRDVPWLLSGQLRESRGGAVPVALLADTPASGTTVTDPTLWLVGLLKSGVKVTQVVGAEGSAEYVQVEGFTVEELV